MPKIVDRDHQRREILDAARRVFAANGVHGTGLSHVAAEAGMGRSSLYHYYSDREAIVSDLVGELLTREEELCHAARGWTGSAAEKIRRLTIELIGAVDEWCPLGSLLLDLRKLEGARFRGFFETVRNEITELLVEGQRAGEIDGDLDAASVSCALVGAVDGVLLQRLVDPQSGGSCGQLRETIGQIVDKVLRP